MAEPVSTSLLLGLAGWMAGGVVGGLTDRQCCQLLSRARTRIQERKGLGDNHVAGRVVMIAHAKALQNVLVQMEKQDPGGWLASKAKTDEFYREMRGRFGDIINVCESGTDDAFVALANPNLTDGLDAVLTPAQTDEPGEKRALALTTTAADGAFAHFRALLAENQYPQPPHLRACFDNSDQGWQAGFAHYVAKAVGQDQKFANILLVDTLNKALAIAVDTNAATTSLMQWCTTFEDMLVKLQQGVDETNRQLETMPDAVAEAVVKRLQEGSRDSAVALGIQTKMLVVLARNYADDAVQDFDNAHRAIEEALRVAANEREKAKLPTNLDAAVKAVLQRMAELNDAGDFDGAQSALDAELQAMDDEDAKRAAARGKLYERGVSQAVLRNDAKGAARFVLASAELDGSLGFQELRTVWREWYERGRDKGLNFDLRVSIRLAEKSVEHATDADQRGAALNCLAVALDTLGERESGTKRLEEAVLAYRLVLKEFTRDRVPLNWAATQNNLGIALEILGERESGTKRLEEAVSAHELALEEWTRDCVPLDWAMTQNNLGSALLTLGQRESDTTRLEEAASAFILALEEHTRDRVPLDWAMTQNNLGNTLQELGLRESGTKRLEEAVSAYKLALEERTRDHVPLDWAATRANFGDTLAALAERQVDVSLAQEAVIMIELAVTVLEEGGHETGAAEARPMLTNAQAILAKLQAQ